jgi:ribonuclease R
MQQMPSLQEILKVFEREPGKSFRLREIVGKLGLRPAQSQSVKNLLKGLVRKKHLVYLTKNMFSVARRSNNAAPPAAPGKISNPKSPRPHSGNIITGRLISHRDGYGFVVPNKAVKGTEQDIFIPPDAMSSAMNGDKVEVQVLRPKGDGRLEGRIVSVANRAQKTVVGQFHCGQHYNFVTPFDPRIPFEIVIPRGEEWPVDETLVPGRSRDRQFGGESERRDETPKPAARTARDLEGLVVDVEITGYPRPSTLPRGRVVEILGKREDFGVDVEIIIRKFHLPHQFPAEVLAEAGGAPQFIRDHDRKNRRDFRDLPIVTIDGESAKDFDDAVLVQRLENGNYQLHVHIADVAHYVRSGMALDHEARLRGTSVYFPDRAVPMLPLELSNGICSLNPHVERLVMSALMEFDSQGKMIETELTPGIIRSAERMTYTGVRDILEGKPEALERYAGLVPNFKLMEEFAHLLNRHRVARGSIDFDLPEPQIEFDEFGRMVAITRSERNFAHRVIEEFMLAANEAVAGYLEGRGIPSLYRIHEKPEPRKVIEFEEIAAKFGYSLGVELPAATRFQTNKRDGRDKHARFVERIDTQELEITPRHYQRLTKRLAGKPEERILSYLMLRSLKQARYSPDNSGHFALAADSYTHFTSPIRRYPDLIVHRILKAAFDREGGSVRVVADDAGHLPLKKVKPSGSPKRRKVDMERVSPDSVMNAGSAGQIVPGGAFISEQELESLGVATSESERRAADAERELMEWKKVAFMAQHVGDEFDALIISLIKAGFFVELTDLFVEGFVPLSSLGDDFYVYRENQRAIIGEKTHRAFHLGERVRVRLVRIDRSGNKLEFAIAPGSSSIAAEGRRTRGN